MGDDTHMAPPAIAGMLSVLLHLLILSALLRVATGLAHPPPLSNQEATADKLRGAGERIARVELLRAGVPMNGLTCSGSSYVGVGVLADPRTQRIILVGDDTPASRGGLQHDDIVLNPDVWRDSRQEGTLLRVQILREGVTMIVSVRVAKICID